jgi:biopolymer transport protein ExbD
MFSSRKRKKSIHFELIPMIDVMMILVLFLAIMAFLPQVQSALQTDLPGSNGDDKVSMEDLLVSINETGGVFVGDRSVTMNSLVSEVQREMGDNTSRRVVIAADKNLAYEYVVGILSALRKAGIRNVALATEGAS